MRVTREQIRNEILIAARVCELRYVANARMTTRADRMAREILIAARVAELRHLANETAENYELALAQSGMPREHFNLRLMLKGVLPSSRK
jgi:hypothetical protein